MVSSDQPITVFLVEGHDITRMGLRLALHDNSRIAVVGEASSVDEAFEAISRSLPAVVLVSATLPEGDGLTISRAIKSKLPAIRVILLTGSLDDRQFLEGLSCGVEGYCYKETPSADLILGIQAVATGSAWFCPSSAITLLGAFNEVNVGLLTGKTKEKMQAHRLSEREVEVMNLVVQGLTNQEIAERLSVGPETIKSYMRIILAKLDAKDRTEAAVKSMKLGLFT